MAKKILLGLLMLVVMVGVTGCITVKKQTVATNNLGGVFLSSDRAETWAHRSQLMTPGETPGSIGNVNAYFMKFDPSDPDYIFLGTQENGLFYSYNGGAGWIPVKGLEETSFIRDFAVDTNHKCRSFAAKGTKLYRSEDCMRTWKDVFFTDSASKYVSAVDVDWFDSKIVWMGLSDGTLNLSQDYGVSWTPVKTFPNRIKKIVVDPFDSRKVFVGVTESGLYKTDNKGETWSYLNDGMKDFKGTGIYYDYVVSPGSQNLVLYASKFGMLRSLDGGLTWKPLEILSKPGEEEIYTIALDSKNANNIYYATDKALYKTLDGGSTWIIKNMPTTRIARELVVHPKDGTKVFMGVFLPVEK